MLYRVRWGGGRGGGFASAGSHLKLAAAIVMLVLALALSACGTGNASTPDAAADIDGPSVVIEDLTFEPDTLTVQAGATVTWVWNDGAVQHDVSGEELHSEVRSEGTFRQRFDEPGSYDYVCTLHPNMTGTIEVTG